MLRTPSIPVESPALSFAPKPKLLSQPKPDGLATPDRSAFRASLKEAQSTSRADRGVGAVREATSAKEAPRPTDPATATNAREAGGRDDRPTSADAERTAASSTTAKQHDTTRDDAPDAQGKAPVAATEGTVPTDAASSTGQTDATVMNAPHAAPSVIAADAPGSAVDATGTAATKNPSAHSPLAPSLDAAQQATGANAASTASGASALETAIPAADTTSNSEPAVTRQDPARAAMRASAPLSAPVSAADAATGAANTPTNPPPAATDVRAAAQPANTAMNSAPIDAASSAVSATASAGGAAEQQAQGGDDQSRGEGRSRDGRSFNVPSFGAARNDGEAPAIARAESIDQAVKLSQATGRMPTATIEGLPGSAAPNSPSAVGARDAVTAQFVPMNAAADEASPFASRVVRGLHTMLNHRGGSMTMRLDPPELGALKVQMTLRDGAVTAMFTAATAKAHSLLREHMGTLRASLESQGLTVERLSVQSMTTTTGGQGASDANARHEQSGAQSDREQSGQQADAGHGQSRGHREHDERGDGTHARRHAERSFEQSFEEQLAG